MKVVETKTKKCLKNLKSVSDVFFVYVSTKYIKR